MTAGENYMHVVKTLRLFIVGGDDRPVGVPVFQLAEVLHGHDFNLGLVYVDRGLRHPSQQLPFGHSDHVYRH